MEQSYYYVVSEKATKHPKPSEISSENWQEDGYLLKLKNYDLTPTIKKESIPEKWRLEETGPFDRNGNVKQGYFFDISNKFVQELFEMLHNSFPVEILPNKQKEVKILQRAEENPTLPYLVLLDEMNLARVEYYFSDILSVMESRRWEDG